jgi:Protein of unknown function (DUF1257)
MVQTQLRDPDAIKAAAKALGIEFVEQGLARLYGGEYSSECDFVLRLPGRYDLGLKKNAAGTYDFVCDAWLLEGRWAEGANHPGTKSIGLNGSRLKQEYAYAILQAEARRKGRTIQRQELPNGRIRVTLTGGR